jgi:hypothetical protein
LIRPGNQLFLARGKTKLMPFVWDPEKIIEREAAQSFQHKTKNEDNLFHI